MKGAKRDEGAEKVERGSKEGEGYILEDCFLSSGSHIRHGDSPEEPVEGCPPLWNIPDIDQATREGCGGPTANRGESWRINFRHCPPSPT
jgi:hypothetical protein